MVFTTWADALSQSFQNLFYGLVAFIPNVVVAVIIFIVGWLVGVGLGREAAGRGCVVSVAVGEPVPCVRCERLDGLLDLAFGPAKDEVRDRAFFGCFVFCPARVCRKSRLSAAVRSFPRLRL